MKAQLFVAILALGVFAAAGRGEAGVTQLGANASSADIIRQLSPPPGFRGLRLLRSDPTAEAQMPAVGLDIRFKLNSAELSDDAKATIKQLADAISSPQLAKYRFLVEGHTDSTGTAQYNMALSKRRAQAVRSYLIETYGVAPSRLRAVGRGQTQPIDPADPANPANRRVQVVNLGQ